MRKSVKEVLTEHRDEEDVILAWISEATRAELQEFIRIAAKNGLTMGYILPAQMALDAKHSEPHWTVSPTFWLVLATLIICLLAWLFPRSPESSSSRGSSESHAEPTAAAPQTAPSPTATPPTK